MGAQGLKFATYVFQQCSVSSALRKIPFFRIRFFVRLSDKGAPQKMGRQNYFPKVKTLRKDSIIKSEMSQSDDVIDQSEGLLLFEIQIHAFQQRELLEAREITKNYQRFGWANVSLNFLLQLISKAVQKFFKLEASLVIIARGRRKPLTVSGHACGYTSVTHR